MCSDYHWRQFTLHVTSHSWLCNFLLYLLVFIILKVLVVLHSRSHWSLSTICDVIIDDTSVIRKYWFCNICVFSGKRMCFETFLRVTLFIVCFCNEMFSDTFRTFFFLTYHLFFVVFRLLSHAWFCSMCLSQKHFHSHRRQRCLPETKRMLSESRKTI